MSNELCRRGTFRSLARRGKAMIASVNLEFPSFAPRHRLSKLISALGLALVATVARYESATCDDGAFRIPKEWL